MMVTDPGPQFAGSPLDFQGMRAASRARLRAEMKAQGIGAAWLLGSGNVRFVVGSSVLPADAGRATHQRASVLVLADDELPHLFTPHPAGAPPELPPEHVHDALHVETEPGVRAAVREIRERLGDGAAGASFLAIDEYSPALFFHLDRLLGAATVDATPLMSAARIRKSAEEIECVRRAQHINEQAMLSVLAALRPGLRYSELTALFFDRIYALGACANGIDPIWQAMAPRLADNPWTTHGGIAFPACTTDRVLRAGDVLWVDTGIDYHGYQSDFGRTFVVGARPSARQLDQGKRWLDMVEAVLGEVRPGTTGLALTRRATEVARLPSGARPWPAHFYLIHGIGTDPAEQPLVGTDLGDAFDERIVLAPGMLLVLEPTIWDDGFGGYRAEEIVAVTDTGYRQLTRHTYAPYEASMGTGIGMGGG